MQGSLNYLLFAHVKWSGRGRSRAISDHGGEEGQGEQGEVEEGEEALLAGFGAGLPRREAPVVDRVEVFDAAAEGERFGLHVGVIQELEHGGTPVLIANTRE